MEVADWAAIMNIENNGETKNLMIKTVKRRDTVSDDDSAIIGIRQPFLSTTSFSLMTDINENYTMATPIYIGKRITTFLAQI